MQTCRPAAERELQEGTEQVADEQLKGDGEVRDPALEGHRVRGVHRVRDEAGSQQTETMQAWLGYYILPSFQIYSEYFILLAGVLEE